jgi:hypothetical protein
MAQTKKGLPGIGFFLAVCLGALAFVGGAAAIVLDRRDGEGFHWSPFVALVFGIAMITLAFITERPGKYARVGRITLNIFIVFCACVILLGLLLVVLGPLH